MYSIFEQLLQKNGVTTYKVSKDTGIAQSVFSSWKKGVSTPKTDKLKIIADYFGVTLEYLTGEPGKTEDNIYQVKDSSERDVLLLCRKVGEISKEDRDEIINQFKNSIDFYLRAKGIKGE